MESRLQSVLHLVILSFVVSAVVEARTIPISKQCDDTLCSPGVDCDKVAAKCSNDMDTSLVESETLDIPSNLELSQDIHSHKRNKRANKQKNRSPNELLGNIVSHGYIRRQVGQAVEKPLKEKLKETDPDSPWVNAPIGKAVDLLLLMAGEGIKGNKYLGFDKPYEPGSDSAIDFRKMLPKTIKKSTTKKPTTKKPKPSVNTNQNYDDYGDDTPAGSSGKNSKSKGNKRPSSSVDDYDDQGDIGDVDNLDNFRNRPNNRNRPGNKKFQNSGSIDNDYDDQGDIGDVDDLDDRNRPNYGNRPGNKEFQNSGSITDDYDDQGDNGGYDDLNDFRYRQNNLNRLRNNKFQSTGWTRDDYGHPMEAGPNYADDRDYFRNGPNNGNRHRYDKFYDYVNPIDTYVDDRHHSVNRPYNVNRPRSGTDYYRNSMDIGRTYSGDLDHYRNRPSNGNHLRSYQSQSSGSRRDDYENPLDIDGPYGGDVDNFRNRPSNGHRFRNTQFQNVGPTNVNYDYPVDMYGNVAGNKNFNENDPNELEVGKSHNQDTKFNIQNNHVKPLGLYNQVPNYNDDYGNPMDVRSNTYNTESSLPSIERHRSRQAGDRKTVTPQYSDSKVDEFIRPIVNSNGPIDPLFQSGRNPGNNFIQGQNPNDYEDPMDVDVNTDNSESSVPSVEPHRGSQFGDREGFATKSPMVKLSKSFNPKPYPTDTTNFPYHGGRNNLENNFRPSQNPSSYDDYEDPIDVGVNTDYSDPGVPNTDYSDPGVQQYRGRQFGENEGLATESPIVKPNKSARPITYPTDAASLSYGGGPNNPGSTFNGGADTSDDYKNTYDDNQYDYPDTQNRDMSYGVGDSSTYIQSSSESSAYSIPQSSQYSDPYAYGQSFYKTYSPY